MPGGSGDGEWGQIAFEPGAVLAAAHYLCTYIDRSPFSSFLPRAGEEGEGRAQRLSVFVPGLQQQQQQQHAQVQVQRQGQGQGEAKSSAATTAQQVLNDGRVNIIFNPYRQVAAVAVPSPSSMYRVHKKRIPLRDVLDTQPQVKIVPGVEELTSQTDAAMCALVSLGRDMHFLLIDVTRTPQILSVLTAAPGASKNIDSLGLEIDGDPASGWGSDALRKGFVGAVWYVRGKKDEKEGEATIENVRTRVFGDVNGWEEEGLGSAAGVVAGWLAVGAGVKNGGKGLVEGVSRLKVEGEEENATGKVGGTQSRGEVEGTSAKERIERKVFGIQQGVEIGRNSTIAVEVDVKVDGDGKEIASMVISGRANFETKGELLGA
jgi:hypothetical protein